MTQDILNTRRIVGGLTIILVGAEALILGVALLYTLLERELINS